MKQLMVQLGRDSSGATAIEYAMMASLISVALVLIFHTIGDTLAAMLMNVVAGL